MLAGHLPRTPRSRTQHRQEVCDPMLQHGRLDAHRAPSGSPRLQGGAQGPSGLPRHRPGGRCTGSPQCQDAAPRQARPAAQEDPTPRPRLPTLP
eukprot:4460339-Pyramimonas_sp.AAC.1